MDMQTPAPEHASDERNLQTVEILLERTAVRKLRRYAARQNVTIERLVRYIVNRVLNGDPPPVRAEATGERVDVGAEDIDAAGDESTGAGERVYDELPDEGTEAVSRRPSTPGAHEKRGSEGDRRSKATSEEGSSVLDELRETVDRLSSLEREDASTRSETDLRARITKRIEAIKAKRASDPKKDEPPSMFDLAP